MEGNSNPFQLIPFTNADSKLQDKYFNLHVGAFVGSAPKYFLVFVSAIPPLGYTSFVVRTSSADSKNKSLSIICNKGYDSAVCLWTHSDGREFV